MSDRHIVWFSCGAASAVVAKIVSEKFKNLKIVYCDVLANEHPDNLRFLHDVERWVGTSITIISSDKFKDVESVFSKRRYMSGPKGAPCTVEMKKIPRFKFQEADDIHHFGYTVDEKRRIDRFENNNPELVCVWDLHERKINKKKCFHIISDANIEIPKMYQLGYKNNNCIGCVKATSAAYWMRIRKDFPDVFDSRVRQSRDIGARLTRWKGERIFLDELPVLDQQLSLTESISCGPECGGRR